MNIGAIGWWYYDNQGDLAMLDTLRHALVPHRIVPLNTDLSFNEDTLSRFNRLDYLLLGGGTLIRGRPLPVFRDFRKWGKRLRTPIGVLGLGVSHIERDCMADVNALIAQADFFYVRDKTSRELLDHDRVQVAPDLTFACPLEMTVQRLSVRQSPLCGINLRDTDGLNAEAWFSALRQLPCRWRGLPLSSFNEWQEHRWLRQLDPDCATSFSPELYEGLDVVIGTALHSIIFAVQAGIPVIAISYASKVARFMAELGLDRFSLSPTAVDELSVVYKDLIHDYESIRNRIGSHRERMVQDSRSMFDTVRASVLQGREGKRNFAARISVVVLDCSSPEALRDTVVSCRDQTGPEPELVIVSAGQPGVLADRVVSMPSSASQFSWVNAGVGHASGTYVTWIRAGDRFMPDALDFLAARLQETHASAVYADYYTFQEGRITAQVSAAPAYKLKRHNVVTPCFLYDRDLQADVGPYNDQSLLPGYAFWLQVAANHKLVQVHTPLLLVPGHPKADGLELERAVRREYAASLPLPQRLLWRSTDNVVADRLLQIARSALRRLKKLRGLTQRLRIQYSELDAQ